MDVLYNGLTVKKFLYFLEFALLFAGLVYLALGFSAPYSETPAITLPTHKEIQNSVTGAPAAADKNLEVVCNNPATTLTGFPFVYKTSDGCSEGTGYEFSRVLDYVAALAAALLVTKVTSMVVNRFTRIK